MKSIVIGFDTSNYRTSSAAVTVEGEILMNSRLLLPVETGERGLRQSEAVFAHLKQMRKVVEPLRSAVKNGRVVAVCVSTKPRNSEESYMPVFQVGDAIGRSLAAAMDVPCFFSDHQWGHIRAAQHGTNLENKKDFLAFHLSGGTTDLLSVQGETLTELGKSLDLHAGQLVDRIGVEMGLPFPAGEEMEKLAVNGQCTGILGCSMTDDDLNCHFSGAETRAIRLLRNKSIRKEDLALEIYDLLARTVNRMLKAGMRETGLKDALIAGGIASSELFREMLLSRCCASSPAMNLFFGAPEYSGDNAVGIALIGADRFKKTKNISLREQESREYGGTNDSTDS